MGGVVEGWCEGVWDFGILVLSYEKVEALDH